MARSALTQAHKRTQERTHSMGRSFQGRRQAAAAASRASSELQAGNRTVYRRRQTDWQRAARAHERTKPLEGGSVTHKRTHDCGASQETDNRKIERVRESANESIRTETRMIISILDYYYHYYYYYYHHYYSRHTLTINFGATCYSSAKSSRPS